MMHRGREVKICDCCAIWLANGDDSGCRGYYGHAHELCQYLNGRFVIDGNDEEKPYTWTCEGCGDGMAAHANQWKAVELIPVPHSNYPHWPGYLPGCPACDDRCNCGHDVFTGHAAPCCWTGHPEEEEA